MDTFFKNMRGIIALIVVVCSFIFLFMLILKTMPEGNKEILMLSAGLVLAALSGVCGYYFGSSKDKSDADKASLPTTPPIDIATGESK